jgi:hypothetical protein
MEVTLIDVKTTSVPIDVTGSDVITTFSFTKIVTQRVENSLLPSVVVLITKDDVV